MKKAVLASVVAAAVVAGCTESGNVRSELASTTGPTAIVQNTGLPPEGCSPGFWKNHTEAWPPTGYTTGQTLESVFDVPDSLDLDDVTLLEALETGGGGITALLRQAVAGLLSASHPDVVDYPALPQYVIGPVNTALASGDIDAVKKQLEAWNNIGAPGFCD
jgi:hypothetical protein